MNMRWMGVIVREHKDTIAVQVFGSDVVIGQKRRHGSFQADRVQAEFQINSVAFADIGQLPERTSAVQKCRRREISRQREIPRRC